MAPKVRHGHTTLTTQSHEYICWAQMKQRCKNPKNPSWDYYGGRGITVCQRWERFDDFIADVGLAPSPAHSLDRYPDNDGNYEPGNVRWATRSEQMRNARPPRQSAERNANIAKALRGKPWSAARRAAQQDRRAHHGER